MTAGLFPPTSIELEFQAVGFEWENGVGNISSDFLSTSLGMRPRERKGALPIQPGTESLQEMDFPWWWWWWWWSQGRHASIPGSSAEGLGDCLL